MTQNNVKIKLAMLIYLKRILLVLNSKYWFYGRANLIGGQKGVLASPIAEKLFIAIMCKAYCTIVSKQWVPRKKNILHSVGELLHKISFRQSWT